MLMSGDLCYSQMRILCIRYIGHSLLLITASFISKNVIVIFSANAIKKMNRPRLTKGLAHLCNAYGIYVKSISDLHANIILPDDGEAYMAIDDIKFILQVETVDYELCEEIEEHLKLIKTEYEWYLNREIPCPRCESTDVREGFDKPRDIEPPINYQMHCNSCQYEWVDND